jgi:hypothetical protein
VSKQEKQAKQPKQEKKVKKAAGDAPESDAPKKSAKPKGHQETSRLHLKYGKEVIPALVKHFKYANVMAVPKLEKIVINMGLGEALIVLKGMLIVQGAYYVPTPELSTAAVYNGLIVGILSATVLFANSFPDFEADKRHGRHTLVILLGRKYGAKFFTIFILVPYALIVVGTLDGYTKVYTLVCLTTLPLAIRAIVLLNKDFIGETSLLIVMSNTIWCSRLTGSLLAISLIM